MTSGALTRMEFYDSIDNVHFSAFSEQERETVRKLAIDLLHEKTQPQILSLVAESDSLVVGHVAFSPVTISLKNWLGYILAPLGVRPEYQNQSVGAELVKNGMQRLLSMHINAVFVYGDPRYYGKFGFNADLASMYLPPYDIQYPFGWQAIICQEWQSITTPLRISCVQSLSDPKLW